MAYTLSLRCGKTIRGWCPHLDLQGQKFQKNQKDDYHLQKSRRNNTKTAAASSCCCETWCMCQQARARVGANRRSKIHSHFDLATALASEFLDWNFILSSTVICSYVILILFSDPWKHMMFAHSTTPSWESSRTFNELELEAHTPWAQSNPNKKQLRELFPPRFDKTKLLFFMLPHKVWEATLANIDK